MRTLGIVIGLLGVACGETPQDRPLDPRWHELRQKALIRREEVRAVVANHLGHWNAVRKYQALFQMFRVEDRIPVGPRADELARDIEARARAVGFTTVQVETRMPEPDPMPPPETVETPGGYAFRPEEVAGSLDVLVRARPADLRLAERLVDSLRKSLPRLFIPKTVRLTRGEVVVKGSAFFFRDIRPPIQVLRPPDLSKDLAAAGLPADPPDSATADILLDLTRLYGETAVDVALSVPSLSESARARLLSARFDLFKNRAREAEAIRFSSLLE